MFIMLGIHNNELVDIYLLTQTPLTRACQFGKSEVVKFLVGKGAKVYPVALINAIEGHYM